MTRRSYKGTSQPTVLTAPISNSDLAASVADGSTLPDGISAPFVLTINRQKTGEEKILVASRSANSLVFAQRGFDGTTPSSHDAGESVEHTISAVDLDEANGHVNDSTGDPHPQYLTPAEGNAAYVLRTETLSNAVLTNESTSSTTFADLATVGPTVTVTVGASGRVLVMPSTGYYNSAAGNFGIMGVALSGANTAAASDPNGVQAINTSITNGGEAMAPILLTGLTPGVTTFTAKYRVGSGTGSFFRRRLVVMPL